MARRSRFRSAPAVPAERSRQKRSVSTASAEPCSITATRPRPAMAAITAAAPVASASWGIRTVVAPPRACRAAATAMRAT